MKTLVGTPEEEPRPRTVQNLVHVQVGSSTSTSSAGVVWSPVKPMVTWSGLP